MKPSKSGSRGREPVTSGNRFPTPGTGHPVSAGHTGSEPVREPVPEPTVATGSRFPPSKEGTGGTGPGRNTPNGEQMSTRKRTRSSAKAAGTRFETNIATYLAEQVDDRIERRARNGGKDRGDIGGVRLSPALGGKRVVIECKDTTRLALAGWATEAEAERGNDDAVAGLVVHKRHGVGDPGEQWVTCTVADLVALLTGARPEEAENEEVE